MSAKDNAALGQLLELLEARYALRVLWALKDGHPQTFRLLQDSIGQITPNTLNTRIKELRAAGLLDHLGEGYVVTYLGADLLNRLNDLQAFATKWTISQAKSSAAKAAPSAKKSK
jgi:DNA-binding HxlR family transcriptional regulator